MQDKVKGPAIGLVIVGVLGVVILVINLVAAGFAETLMRAVGASEADLEQFRDTQKANFVVNAVFSVFGLAWNGFVIWGGLQMMKLGNRTVAIIASVLAMIPCLSPCCIVGLPIGIWSLVVLMKDDVKRAFEGQPPAL